ncbi:hypothetical protein [Micromonospora sp. NPDC023633]|uniref:hypothetical protein n=1 Tax=Micromonospora sp. NPDC023633 TaxID=3154320 RepID=UPI0033C4E318
MSNRGSFFGAGGGGFLVGDGFGALVVRLGALVVRLGALVVRFGVGDDFTAVVFDGDGDGSLRTFDGDGVGESADDSTTGRVGGGSSSPTAPTTPPQQQIITTTPARAHEIAPNGLVIWMGPRRKFQRA